MPIPDLNRKFTELVGECQKSIVYDIYKPSGVVGMKFDTDKPMWDLLPYEQLSNVVDVLTYGAKKYSKENWKRVQNPKDRYFAAAMRHLIAWRKGERLDGESELPHLSHAICCLLFLDYFDTLNEDD